MRRVQRFTLRALYPATDNLPGIDELGLDEFLDRFHGEASLAMRAGLVLGSVVFVAAPAVVVGVPLPAFLLPPRLLDRYASRIGNHRAYALRLATMLVKIPAGLHYGSHPEVRSRLRSPSYQADPGTWRAA